jgi:ubiquinone/menaquinone biosynthesis C-methylase UbiE
MSMQVEFSKFVRDLAVSLKSNSVLEVGCNEGNLLQAFEGIKVIGIDTNSDAIKKAQYSYPSFTFHNASVTKIPLPDSSVDLIFTHKTLNLVPNDEMEKAVSEIFRVANRYILTCEIFSTDEEEIDEITSQEVKS